MRLRPSQRFTNYQIAIRPSIWTYHRDGNGWCWSGSEVSRSEALEWQGFTPKGTKRIPHRVVDVILFKYSRLGYMTGRCSWPRASARERRFELVLWGEVCEGLQIYHSNLNLIRKDKRW
jgi:hypothetical protein